ncbi:hypothetical protein LUZ60_009081 [Juncus effusus]|nr:hypothetical protein LUZ60_009081 [Juncus effusus]
MAHHGYLRNASRLINLAKLAIDRSRGGLEEFWIQNFVNDNLLQYLCDRTSVLKSLRLRECRGVSDKGLIETAKRQPLLEELEITHGYDSNELLELVGKELPNLKRFKFNSPWFNKYFSAYSENEVDKYYNEGAFGIAKTMHQFRYLQLVGNM